jgi:hypothetical protein
MRRRSSGQVLIGAATLMLVILLTMAASLPVINTSIDPSSEAMEVMVRISETLAKRVFLEIGAAQCANEMIGRPTYAISTTAALAVAKARSAFVERLKNFYPGLGIKNLNIEVLDSSIYISLPRFGGPATIGDRGEVKNYPLGDISVSIRIGFRVTYYVDKGKGNLVFKKFIYYERFFATTDTRYGGALVLVDTNSVKDLSLAMPDWLDTAIGFIPVIGDIYTIASAPTYFKYRMAFNVGRAIRIEQYDASGKLVGSVSKGEGATPRYDLTLNKVDAKVNDKLIITFFNRPDKSYKVFLDQSLLPTITKNRKVIELTEYYNIDWVTVALAVIGIISVGDLAKLAKPVRQDLSRGNGLDNDNILSYKINDFYPKEPYYKIQRIKPSVESGMHNQARMYKDVEYNMDNLQLSYAAREMLQQTKKEIKDIVPAGKSWIDELIGAIIRFIRAFFGFSSDLGRQADEGGILNSMVQQELLQNLGSRNDMKLFSDQDPFMWILYPRPGGGGYSACVWLEDFYPILETK